MQEKATYQGNERKDLLVLLQQAQAKLGYIPQEVISDIAKSLNISISEVYGVATFYSFLSPHPRGRNIIRICRSLPCYLKNAQMIIKSVEDELGIIPGETTADGEFSFELTNCIGACDQAPAMLINSDVHGSLTPGAISQILKTYRNR